MTFMEPSHCTTLVGMGLTWFERTRGGRNGFFFEGLCEIGKGFGIGFKGTTERRGNLGEGFEHKLKGRANIFYEILDFFAALSDEVTRNLLTIVIEGTGRVDSEVPIVTGMFKSWTYMFPNILSFDEGFEDYLDVVTTGQTKVVEMEIEMGKFT